jgi:tRNA1Val (adenine37-N6)-methyltransferase
LSSNYLTFTRMTESFFEKAIETSELVIEIERHKYTLEYIDLVKDFYLKM